MFQIISINIRVTRQLLQHMAHSELLIILPSLPSEKTRFIHDMIYCIFAVLF